MPQSAREYAEITALIRGILNGYPGNSAIFREYIQNSDDAKASSQIFILDERSFPAESVVDPVLRDTQGPALIAVNDGVLRDVDWKALQKIHSSSKKSDESQTGKNGLGFRASYHLTENPHILSGRTLMILDPHQEFEEHPGGVSIDVVDEGPKYQDQLAPFASVVDDVFSEFNGTIFRLPLRTANQARRSEIKDTPTSVKEIADLLKSFAMSELEQVIIFLKYITSIEVRHIDASGHQSILGKVEIEPLDPSQRLGTVSRTTTLTRHDGIQIIQKWSFHHLVVDKKDAASIISRRLGYDVEDRLATEKLTPTVDVALRLEGLMIQGRLFTLLPLPIRLPGFTLHVNAVFALTPDRQGLKNAQEVGPPESRESLLVEWNRTIFKEWVPTAWANILSELPNDLFLSKGWSAWPPEEHDKECYWTDIAQNFTMEAVRRNLPIFPTIAHDGTEHLVSLADARVLLASPHPTISLNLLPPFGLNIVQLPPHIFAIIEPIASTLSAPILSAGSLHKALLEAQDTGFSLSCDAHIATAIIEYLVFSQSTPNLSHVIGLPWFQTAAGVSVAFEPASSTAKYIVPRSEDESNIFSEDRRMLAWAFMSDKLRSFLVRPQASKILNVKLLSVDDVISRLVSRFDLDSSVDEVAPGCLVDVTWLIQFWSWLARWCERKSFFDKIGAITHLHLLPTSIGSLRKLSAQIIDFRNVNQASIDAWGLLGVYPVHPEVANDASLILCLTQESLAHIPHTSRYIALLMRSCDSARQSRLSQEALVSIRDSLMSGLPRNYRVTLSSVERQTLGSLQIFTVRKVRESLGLGTISGYHLYTDVEDDYPLPLLRNMPNTIYVDWKDSTTRILASIVDSGTATVNKEFDLLQLAVDNWDAQPAELQDVWIEKFLDNWRKLPPLLRSQLEALPFVTVNGVPARVPPRNLIHPKSILANLYIGECGKLPTGRFTQSDYLAIMENLGFVRSTLDEVVVADRLAYLRSSSPFADQHVIQKATEFVKALNRGWDPSYKPLITQSRGDPWLPSSLSALSSPNNCRDMGSGLNARLYYYDKVLSILKDIEITSQDFRLALGWSDIVPSSILVRQLQLTVALPPSAERNKRLVELINYLGRLQSCSNLTAETLDDICNSVCDQSWIPVWRSKSETVKTQHALLSDIHLSPPFRLVDHSKAASFLLRMGCTIRYASTYIEPMYSMTNNWTLSYSPALETLLDELVTTEKTTVQAMVYLLQEIAQYHPAFERESIWVPTGDLKRYPLDKVYYRDTSYVYLSGVISDRAPVHNCISRELAEKLKIEFLGSLVLGDDDDDDEQMSEDLVGRIRGFLRDYDPRYAINEFLANADDANATEFSILLSSGVHSVEHVLSSEFKSLYEHPALILHNNATLSDDDFLGLRRVGRGGKLDRPDTHGRHGLGALSLYYFTDVATIISGEFVMILDPTGTYFPPKRGQKRNVLKQKISHIARHYPDQLKPFERMFNFSSGSPRYEGTLFCLPLESSMNEKRCDYETIRGFIKTVYRDLAHSSFFFTRLERITAAESTHSFGIESRVFWSLEAERSSISPLGKDFTHLYVSIRQRGMASSLGEDLEQKWLVTTSDSTPIPSNHETTAASLKIQTQKMMVQQAIRFDGIEKQQSHSYLFSTAGRRHQQTWGTRESAAERYIVP
ncbi:hypothetical protein BDZ97DRAFT_1919525 [Flammula alnicola]|nr:hypothetical protein BDZ97DRAFT_1919525 [Flammula alnicola]